MIVGEGEDGQGGSIFGVDGSGVFLRGESLLFPSILQREMLIGIGLSGRITGLVPIQSGVILKHCVVEKGGLVKN